MRCLKELDILLITLLLLHENGTCSVPSLKVLHESHWRNLVWLATILE